MSAQKVLNLYKNIGETPLECLERFRSENPEYEGLPMTYAGRLDPMAEGLLLILVGEECKKKEEYLGLDKEYEGEILFGFETDTGDVLGLPKKDKKLKIRNEDHGEIQTRILSNYRIAAESLEGKRLQKYPAFSSKPVPGPREPNGARTSKKPLWQWARESEEVDIPDKKVEVYSFYINSCRQESYSYIRANVRERIEKVNGDFRQEEILAEWERVLPQQGEATICKFKAKVSSGTYIRSLASTLGEKLDTKALLFSLKRTRVGFLE